MRRVSIDRHRPYAALVAALTLRAATASAQPTPQRPTGTPPTGAQTPATPPANAQVSEAQVRFDRGMELFNARNYEGALAEFLRSYELSGRAGMLFNIGLTYRALARYPEAARTIEDYLRSASDLTPGRRTEVETALQEIRNFIARLRVVLVPPVAQARVTLDGEALPATTPLDAISVGAGRHTIEVSAPGYETGRANVLVASGDEREVRVELTRRPDGAHSENITRLAWNGVPTGAQARVDGTLVSVATPFELTPGSHRVELHAPGRVSWRGEVNVPAGVTRTLTPRLAETRGLSPVWFIATASATGVFAITAAVFGALTLSTSDEFHTLTREDARAQELADRGTTFRTVTNITLGLAVAAGVASGVVLWQTRFRTTSTVEVAAGLDGSARVRVAF